MPGGGTGIIKKALYSYRGKSDALGTNSRIMCSALTELPDYDNQSVLILNGPCRGQSKDISGTTTGGQVNISGTFSAVITAGVHFLILTQKPATAEVAAIEATLGALDTAAATGAVSDVKAAMAYIKQLVTGLALDGSAPHSYDYTKATVPGWLHGFHMVRRILFVIPEAIGSITVHNTAIRAELDKMGLVITITQADALTYPDYESITLTVLGSPLAGSAWNTANLLHIKSIFGLPVVCVDATAAVYLKMGTDGVNADTKTVLNAIPNIEGSILGVGIDDTIGLDDGANDVADAPGVTFSTLDMSDGNITKVWYAYESVNDHTDVILGEIRKTMPDATPGKDLDGADVPGTLAFYGCAYSMDGLNTLGKAVFHLLVEKLLHSSTAGLAVILSGEVGNLAATIGVRATPAATGAVDNVKKAMAYLKQLVTSQRRQLFSMDFWSDTQEELLINATAADKALPKVFVEDLPGTATIVRAIAMFKFRMVENVFDGANAINVAQHIQVQSDAPGTWRDAISIADNLFNFAAVAREGGDILIGDHDIAVEVVGNDGYNFQWEAADADQISINFNDIQCGLKIWYSV